MAMCCYCSDLLFSIFFRQEKIPKKKPHICKKYVLLLFLLYFGGNACDKCHSKELFFLACMGLRKEIHCMT